MWRESSRASKALLIGLHAVQDAAPGGSRMPRQPWALKVLAEQLLCELPPNSPVGQAIRGLHDPKRGVTSLAIHRATEDLVSSNYLVGRDVGHDATWAISPDREAEVDAMVRGLSTRELAAARRAAYDAVAISEAWSNTFRAATPTKSAK
jgi:hypothetical protein